MKIFDENEYIAEEWKPYIEKHQSVAGIKIYIIEIARELHRLTNIPKGPIYTHVTPSQQDRIDQLRHLILVAGVDMRKEIASIEKEIRQEAKNAETEKVASLLQREEALLRQQNLKLTRSATGAAILSAIVAIFSFAKSLSDDGCLEKRMSRIEQINVNLFSKNGELTAKVEGLNNEISILKTKVSQKNDKLTSPKSDNSVPTSKKDEK